MSVYPITYCAYVQHKNQIAKRKHCYIMTAILAVLVAAKTLKTPILNTCCSSED